MRADLFKGIQKREFDRSYLKKVRHNQSIAEIVNELSRVEGYIERLHPGLRSRSMSRHNTKRDELRQKLAGMKVID